MDASVLIPLLVNGGTAGLVLILMVSGILVPKSVLDDVKAERDYQRERAESERDRADAAVAAAQATNNVLAALHTGVQLGRVGHDSERAPTPPELGSGAA